MFACLFAATWPPDPAGSALPAELLAVVPRITLAGEVIWCDVHGLNAPEVAGALLERASACGVTDVRVAVAAVPVVAELAARHARAQTVTLVEAEGAAFIAPLPLSLFAGHEKLLLLLDGVGVRTCGELASLDREAVEVRFGAEALLLWQWSRAQDARRFFHTIAPERLHATTDFVDYVVTDPERLIFVTNALLSSICDQLRSSGLHARSVLLTLALGNRTSWQRVIRPARATASRTVWLRLVRALLERLTVADAVTGVQIEVIGTEAAAAVQGDLFDSGFATAAAVENALARLLEVQGDVVVKPEHTRHPLAEQRTAWLPADLRDLDLSQTIVRGGSLEMHLRLLPEPKEVLVETVTRRDHVLPIRFRDDKWQQLVTAAGPDRISGGKWDESYAREYFRGVTVEGQLVWLFRDAKQDRWYLQGYWD